MDLFCECDIFAKVALIAASLLARPLKNILSGVLKLITLNSLHVSSHKTQAKTKRTVHHSFPNCVSPATKSEV